MVDIIITISLRSGLLSDAQPSRVARSIALSPPSRSEERSSEQRWINIVNQHLNQSSIAWTQVPTVAKVKSSHVTENMRSNNEKEFKIRC